MRRGFDGVSWYQAEPRVSLELIAASAIAKSAGVIDVGGGASLLVDQLIAAGFGDVSLLDVSAVAVGEARRRLAAETPVSWLVQDLLTWRPSRHYDLWHDRAVFHFLVSAELQDAYRAVLLSALEPGGYVVVGVFAPEGPQSCSGLPVARYSGPQIASALGGEFSVMATRQEVHGTPSGGAQPFTWVLARRVE